MCSFGSNMIDKNDYLNVVGMYKRLLVIGNNCFSQENSNGRTMSGFVKGWPIDHIAQFYTYNELPNSDVCNNYFRVTDKQALLSIFKGPVAGKIIFTKFIQKPPILKKSLAKYRNPLVLLLRNFIWNIGFWKGKHFMNWVNEFNPEVIFAQAGDTAFRLKIATDLAKEKNIPLVVYNSEGYYFKRYNYMKDARLTKLFYPLFINNFRNQLRKTVEYAAHTFYSCESLKEDFDLEFNMPSSVIYTASDITPTINYEEKKNLKLSYIGNLGLNRHKSLIELANVIQRIDPTLTLDIYGKCPTDNILKAFKDCSAISYKGFINYNAVKDVIASSDILFHVENFENFYIEDLKYGFSTKIADSLMSGKCFFIYAPESLACTKYMLSYIPDCVATNINDLSAKVKIIIENHNSRIHYSKKCLKIAEQNHTSYKVTNQFFNLVHSL